MKTLKRGWNHQKIDLLSLNCLYLIWYTVVLPHPICRMPYRPVSWLWKNLNIWTMWFCGAALRATRIHTLLLFVARLAVCELFVSDRYVQVAWSRLRTIWWCMFWDFYWWRYCSCANFCPPAKLYRCGRVTTRWYPTSGTRSCLYATMDLSSQFFSDRSSKTCRRTSDIHADSDRGKEAGEEAYDSG